MSNRNSTTKQRPPLETPILCKQCRQVWTTDCTGLCPACIERTDREATDIRQSPAGARFQAALLAIAARQETNNGTR